MPKLKEPVAPSNGQDEAEEKPQKAAIQIPAFNFGLIHVQIVGTTPLICHAFPEKEKKRMLGDRLIDDSVKEKEAGGKKTRKPRAARNPEEEYKASLYPLEDKPGYGFPAIAFKRAIVGACRQVSNLDMTMANRIIFVKATCTSRVGNCVTPCVEIIGKPEMQEDVVRLSGIDKPPDLRWRGVFRKWSAVLDIEYNASMISPEGIYNLIQFAGKCEGVGEQRPSSPKKPGDNGQFTLGGLTRGKPH